MTKKLYIKTYGCQMNEYDSGKIIDVLQSKEKIELIDKPADADIVILNTCSIREKAEEKVFHELGRIRKFKEKNKDLKIGVAGCVAAQEGKNIFKRAPYVNVVFGPQDLHKTNDLLEKSSKIPVVETTFDEIKKFDHLPDTMRTQNSAPLSIMEGCSKYCTYCVVPYTRGEEVSRSLDSILLELVNLIKNGATEIILLGQNVNAYTAVWEGRQIRLGDLIQIISEFEQIKRIRFTTSHPNDVDQNLFDCFRAVPKLVNHFHLPVQSGSNKILTNMKRDYTKESYLKIVSDIRKIRSNIPISSDFIVGFPGETKQDFQETLELVEEVKFDKSYSFIFSPRPGTPAAKMKDEVSKTEKQVRLKELQDLLNQYSKERSVELGGTVQNCMVIGKAKKHDNQLQARTECNRVVNFECNSIDLVGQLVNIRIDEVLPNSLRGSLQT